MPIDKKEEHESKCRRCGRCCYEKYVIDERVFTARRPCPHLDLKTNLCRVYEKRFELNSRCVGVEEGIKLGVFPADCPYVRNMPDYVGSEEGWLDARIVHMIERGALLNADDVRKEMDRQRG